MTFSLRAFRPVHFLLAVLALTLMPLAATAQNYPDFESPYINDYAGLLPPEVEAELTTALTNLREETGVEATVLTIFSTADYGHYDEIEPFATGLFNQWGIGDAESNNGILILVARADRTMRIELGAGYGAAYDKLAARVIDSSFLPAFREDRYSDGIRTGTLEVITRIAQPFAAGQPAPAAAPSSGKGGGFIGWIIGGVVALFAGLLIFGRKITNRFRTCPQCGAKGTITTTKRTIQAATRSGSGTGERTQTCSKCGYNNVVPYTISRITKSSSSSSGGFSGGKSSGGGASGKW
ncbi:TPM domain-containing protein [Vannielia sp.]|uniref:TPM domain-containing protein n=1 Tax=Vannielia sp. TaxID=2813045 RepID=UPI002626AB4E|nr:TPM domain-containing protein [Vannielia sp.]MDF1872456.1 TPM domain-containing protein [Vannielia sp.]